MNFNQSPSVPPVLGSRLLDQPINFISFLASRSIQSVNIRNQEIRRGLAWEAGELIADPDPDPVSDAASDAVAEEFVPCHGQSTGQRVGTEKAFRN
jgi:hypothetical protein